MFSYSPDRYMVAVLRLIKEAQGTERDKAEGNKSKPRVGRCVCASVPGEIFICFWPCVFFTWGLKFGLITTWDVEGELGFSPGAGAAMSIQELSLLPTSCPLPNSQGAGNHAKSPCREQFFWGVSPWLINELGLMEQEQCFGFQRCIPAAPWAPLELAGRCGVNQIRPLVCRHWSHTQPPVTSLASHKHEIHCWFKGKKKKSEHFSFFSK